MPVCKYMDDKGTTAIMAVMRSVGVAVDMNLTIPLHAGNTTSGVGSVATSTL